VTVATDVTRRACSGAGGDQAIEQGRANEAWPVIEFLCSL
jgi:hypothetical protein